MAWHTVFMLLVLGVILKGVQQGLERATKTLMPGLYFILFILVCYSYSHGNFAQAFHFLFDFHIEKITPDIVISALGHAFFTLALGAGAMLTYGAYVPKQVNIATSVCIVAFLDILVAILSGLAIFPLVFAHHLPLNSGPGLMFVTLPIAFGHVEFGFLIGALFFLLLIFAAWMSSINLMEPMVLILQNKLNVNRTKSAIIVALIAWVLGLFVSLFFNVWHQVNLWGFSLFNLYTSFPTDIILPLGGAGFALFAGYVMKKKFTQLEVNPKIYPLWRFLIRYVAPFGILLVFVSGVVSLL